MPHTQSHRSQNRTELQDILMRLMRHYWTAAEMDGERQSQLADLLEDVSEFDVHVVSDACLEWRREHDEPPLPSQLRRACIAEAARRAEQAQAKTVAERTPPQNDPRIQALRDADRAERRAKDDAARLAREQIAKELGYPSWSYMMSIGLVHAVNAAQGRQRGGPAPTAADMGVTATENGAPIAEAAK